MIKDKNSYGFTLLNNLRSKLRFKKSYLTGFTLIELIVVTTIIILITGIFVMGFREGERGFALQRSVHTLAQDLRQVQELAMRVEDFPKVAGTASRGGFGIYFGLNDSYYILFADCDQDGVFDATGNATSCAAATNDVPFPEQLKRRELEQGVTITRLEVFLIPSWIVSTSVIVFIPPDPAVRFYTPLPDATMDALISNSKIELGISDLRAIINVNRAGHIAVE